MTNNSAMKDKKDLLIPKLRFPGFTDTWDRMLLCDCIRIVTPPKKLQASDYKRDGLYPIIDQSKAPLCGYSDDVEAVINENSLGMVIFGDHTCTLKYIDYPFIQGADGIKVFYSKDASRLDSHYLYYFLQSAPLVSDEYKRHFADLKEKEIYLPLSLAEQKRIVALLSSLDDIILSSKDKLEQMKSHKKALLQKLFPAPGETAPEYRFADCNNGSEWLVKRLGELFCRIVEKNTENNQNVLTISAQFGLVSQYDYFHKSVSSNDLTSYILIQRGDFAYNKSRSQGYPYGTVKSLQLYENGVVSPLYLCFRPRNDKTNTVFYGYYFESESFNLELGRVAQEGARNHGLLNISPSDFFDNIRVPIPQPKEQERIAQSLSSIDCLILTYSNRLSQIERYKKGLLQQLFPSFE